MRLPITVPFHDGETPTSVASRLARANGADKAWRFCLDMGLSFQHVANGDAAALDRLAELGGFDRTKLGTWALRRSHDALYLRGQTLRPSALLRTYAVVCPHCLAADMADGRVAPSVRPYGRALWQITGIRTCFEHDVGLVAFRDTKNTDTDHDFVNLTEPHLIQIEEYVKNTANRTPSKLEAYLRDRLAYGSFSAYWLDKLPFYAAMHLCEVLGAVAEYGPKVRFRDLDAHAMWRAGDAGYRIAISGEPGIRSFLNELQTRFHYGHYRWGPKAMFGRLYEWLATNENDPAYDPARDVIRRHIIETMPVGPGDVLFGESITTRKNHSVQSASEIYGLHHKRLQKVLYDAGYLNKQAMQRSPDRAMFDAADATPFLEQLARSVRLSDVGTYLNAHRPIPRMLLEHGYIQPLVAPDTEDLRGYAFDPAELDSFLQRLTAQAEWKIEGLKPIPHAAKQANCSQMEIVRLITDRKLANVGLNSHDRGYRSVYVNVNEIREMVRGPDYEGLRLRDVEKRMGWSSKVVKALVSQGFLPSRTEINPRNRCPQTVVDQAGLDSFNSKYVALHRLARERNIHFNLLKKRLRSVGIYPDPAFTNVPATFYMRDDLYDIL